MKLEPSIKDRISQIGESLTSCQHDCSGVRNEPNSGIVPRGLIYEDRNGSGKGVVVVGLNPGVAKPEENEYRKEHGITYGVTVECWETKISPTRPAIKDFQYFKKPRELINGLGLSGDILWTNIAKCECRDSKNRISFSSEPQTFRFCASLYLKKELDLVDSTWPIIACGKDAFTALSYMFPDRKIIGIPHPTGAGIEFRKLYEGGKLKESVKTHFNDFFASHPKGALWLIKKEAAKVAEL
jgi:hypothetical protein